MVPFIFVLGGSIASFVIGSVIGKKKKKGGVVTMVITIYIYIYLGVALAFVYNAGFFVMSTWIPFLWALIHILIVVVGSYSTITAIL
jgi:hypothetical protein